MTINAKLTLTEPEFELYLSISFSTLLTVTASATLYKKYIKINCVQIVHTDVQIAKYQILVAIKMIEFLPELVISNVFSFILFY